MNVPKYVRLFIFFFVACGLIINFAVIIIMPSLW